MQGSIDRAYSEHKPIEMVSNNFSQNELSMEKTASGGVWFPESTVLFSPLIADPREPVYSVNYRMGSRVSGRKAAAVSLGDDLPIFRWHDIMRCRGDLQIGISSGIWAVFSFRHAPHQDVSQLINTDYLVGIPLTYALDKWSFRLRPYHISGHLGDECMVNQPRLFYKRKNPSFEAIDFITSYQLLHWLRIYGGPGLVFHSDKSFRMKPVYLVWGIELHLFGQKFYSQGLYGIPFFAAHIENWQHHRWDFNMTFKLGYELSKLQRVGRKARFYVAYHQGYSYEGQFFNKQVTYGEVGFSWGF